MAKTGPIVILEDDIEDQELLTEAFLNIGVQNKLIFFIDGVQALEYLLQTDDQPFIILTDMNLPMMSGMEFQRKIQENEYLRRKSIPFIFFTTTDNRNTVEKAYDQPVQGFFKKPADFRQLTETLALIIGYWTRCLHPNASSFKRSFC